MLRMISRSGANPLIQRCRSNTGDRKFFSFDQVHPERANGDSASPTSAAAIAPPLDPETPPKVKGSWRSPAVPATFAAAVRCGMGLSYQGADMNTAKKSLTIRAAAAVLADRN
jgi:hypothetical protein